MGSFKNLLLQNHWANFNQTWHRSFLCKGNSSFFKWRDSERLKIHLIFKKKIFFSRISWPNSIKLGTNYPWVKGIQVYSNKGPGPFQRGDNSERVKNIEFFKKSSPEPLGIIQSNLVQIILGWRGFKIVQIKKRPGPLQRGDNHKNVKIAWGHLKIFLSRTTGPILNWLGTDHP